MAGIADWIADRNADGYADDAAVRLVLDPPGGRVPRALAARLLDVAAVIGLQTHALPLPVVVPPRTTLPDGVTPVVVRTLDDLPALDLTAWQVRAPGDAVPAAFPLCLSRLFAIEGAFLDLDGDLLPDASRIGFVLPDELPIPLTVALANLAARLGLESGGITLPLARDDAPLPLRIELGTGEAELRLAGGALRLTGDSVAAARLVERAAASWPHVTAPETGGAGSALAALRRWLAGDGPAPNAPGDVLWQREWSERWEVDRLLELAERELPNLLAIPRAGATVRLTAFASEPRAVRDELAARLREIVARLGFPDAEVSVLCTFKAGLSWLREVVQPALAGQPVARLRIGYQPFTPPEETKALDLRIRWLQELFPGPELLARDLGLPLDAIEMVELEVSDAIWQAEAFATDGTSLGAWACSPPSQLQPFVAELEDEGSVMVTSGGIGVEADGADLATIWCPSDLEAFWAWWQNEIIPALFNLIDEQGGPRAALQPFFGELTAEVHLSEPNSRLGVREENDSAAEALAEDIYFTTLDAIELYGKRVTEERCNAPGAVVPIVRVALGAAPRAVVTLRAAPERPALAYPDVVVEALRLAGDELVADVRARVWREGVADDAGNAALAARAVELAGIVPPSGPALPARLFVGDHEQPSASLRLPLPSLLDPAGDPATPPMDANIWGEDVTRWARSLARLPEVSAWVEDYSYHGRPIVALSLAAPTPGRLRSLTKEAIVKPTFLVIARHHANEISSTNAALRLAWLCGSDPEWRALLDRVNVLVLPEENPDGAALHVMLSAFPEARQWKHHPARYNALGAEYGEWHFDENTRFGEARARTSLWRRMPADVVVDNHGVPSHEWVQPFAGFGSPPRFGVSYWVVQALLYGIARWVDDPAYPEHPVAVEALRAAVSAKVRDTDIGAWNETYWDSYLAWGQSRLPDRFPGEFRDGMLWHIGSTPPNPGGRSFESRYPKTTVISWVTEVNDETAEGEHLERVARAHLLANQATLELLHAAAPELTRWRTSAGGMTVVRVGRDRPLRIGH